MFPATAITLVIIQSVFALLLVVHFDSLVSFQWSARGLNTNTRNPRLHSCDLDECRRMRHSQRCAQFTADGDQVFLEIITVRICELKRQALQPIHLRPVLEAAHKHSARSD